MHDRKVDEYLSYAQRTHNHEPGYISHKAIFCNSCGDIWLRKYIHPADGWPTPSWEVVARPCIKCGGGQILEDSELDRPPEHLIYFGRRILSNDFLILMEELNERH